MKNEIAPVDTGAMLLRATEVFTPARPSDSGWDWALVRYRFWTGGHKGQEVVIQALAKGDDRVGGYQQDDERVKQGGQRVGKLGAQPRDACQATQLANNQLVGLFIATQPEGSTANAA